MSVLKSKRGESRAEFVYTAYSIYKHTLQFLTRLSARYARIMEMDISHAAFRLADNVFAGNAINVRDEEARLIRERHFLEAQGALSTLKTTMTICYEVLMMNPEGCFTNSKGKVLNSQEAAERIGSMSQEIGDLINKEDALLKGVLKSDKDRYRKALKKKEEKEAQSAAAESPS